MSEIVHEPHQDIIASPELASAKFRAMYEKAKSALDDGYAVEISCKPLKNTRSAQANRAMWIALTEISRQVDWYGNKLTPEEWKEVLSASLRQQRAVPGIEGGFVVLGIRTSRMSVKEMSAMIDLCYAFGNEHGVKFSAPKWMDE